MGMSEDDRIRAKNKIHNEAFEIYEGLKHIGYDTKTIIKYAEFAARSTNTYSRNEIYTEVIKLARRLGDEISD